MRNTGLEEAQAGIKIAGRNINNLRYVDDNTLMAENEEELDSNLDSILKSRGITLPMKVHPVKAIVFPVVMYECQIWTVKKAERQRNYTFELWCWRRLFRVLWTAKRSNQSILKGDQSWVSFGRNDAKAETPELWPPHGKS